MFSPLFAANDVDYDNIVWERHVR